VVLMGLTLDRERFSERRAVARLAKPRRNTPNVLLIVLDTVRADHLSLHGYNRATSPNLERLAQGGVRFDSARATAPWTLPAHASMFTGRWSHELFSGAQQPMTATYPTLAEFLHDRGYETAGFVANTYYCNSWFGLDRGFIHYEDHFDGDTVVSPAAILRCSELGKRLLGVVGWAMDNPLVRKDAARINRELLEWLAHRRHDRPFFAFLNYIDAHDPYVVPAGFDRHFGVKPESPADLAALLNFHQADKTKWSARDAALIHDAYDDCLAALDGRLGRLFNLLRDLKVLDNTLVVVTADHGESLGEHRLYGHAMSLYQPELHVPLIIVGPSGVPKGRVVRETVSLRDLPATVVDRLGFASESPFPGHPLASFWDPAGTRKRPAVDPVLSETSIGAKPTDPKSHVPALRGPMRSLAAGRNVYIRSGKGEEELYDLESDPHETRNLASSPEARSVLEQFRAGLAPFLRDEGPPR
jgi:arylsulfatase A-like enzyme